MDDVTTHQEAIDKLTEGLGAGYWHGRYTEEAEESERLRHHLKQAEDGAQRLQVAYLQWRQRVEKAEAALAVEREARQVAERMLEQKFGLFDAQETEQSQCLSCRRWCGGECSVLRLTYEGDMRAWEWRDGSWRCNARRPYVEDEPERPKEGAAPVDAEQMEAALEMVLDATRTVVLDEIRKLQGAGAETGGVT
jgi:radical SAM protein with 4Fe4S-binding SPASM domain